MWELIPSFIIRNEDHFHRSAVSVPSILLYELKKIAELSSNFSALTTLTLIFSRPQEVNCLRQAVSFFDGNSRLSQTQSCYDLSENLQTVPTPLWKLRRQITQTASCTLELCVVSRQLLFFQSWPFQCWSTTDQAALPYSLYTK